MLSKLHPTHHHRHGNTWWSLSSNDRFPTKSILKWWYHLTCKNKFACGIVFHFAKLLETYPNWIALFDYFEEMGDRWIVEKEHSTILNSFSSWIPLWMVVWWRWSFSCKNLLRFCLFGYVCLYICIVFRLSRNNRLANRIFFLLSLHQCHEKKKMWSVFSKQYFLKDA